MKNNIKILLMIFVFISSFFLSNFSYAYNDFYSENDIMFYNDDETVQNPDNCVTSGTIPSKVWNYFIGKGLTKEQTAGIMGNIYQESHFSPTLWEETDRNLFENTPDGSDSGYGWGLFQWSYSRRYDKSDTGYESGVLVNLRDNESDLIKYVSLEYATNYAAMINITSKTFSDQPEYTSKISETDLNKLLLFELDYMWDEFQNRGYEEVKATATVVDATIAFHDVFEGSNDSPEFVRDVRGGYSQVFYDYFKNIEPGNFSSIQCIDSDDNRLLSYIKRYVWPEYRGKWESEGMVAITPTLDYQTAANTAKAEGRHTGSTFKGFKGIDCAGFISTLVVDSGLDENFVGGRGGWTLVLKDWLSSTDTWEKITVGDDSSNLRLGDIAVYHGAGGHVFMFVGNALEGFEQDDRNVDGISAALDSRAPMVTGYEVDDTFVSNNTKGYVWYRKK